MALFGRPTLFGQSIVVSVRTTEPSLRVAVTVTPLMPLPLASTTRPRMAPGSGTSVRSQRLVPPLQLPNLLSVVIEAGVLMLLKRGAIWQNLRASLIANVASYALIVMPGVWLIGLA